MKLPPSGAVSSSLSYDGETRRVDGSACWDAPRFISIETASATAAASTIAKPCLRTNDARSTLDALRAGVEAGKHASSLLYEMGRQTGECQGGGRNERRASRAERDRRRGLRELAAGQTEVPAHQLVVDDVRITSPRNL